jgi:hypothetical protein
LERLHTVAVISTEYPDVNFAIPAFESFAFDGQFGELFGELL